MSPRSRSVRRGVVAAFAPIVLATLAAAPASGVCPPISLLPRASLGTLNAPVEVIAADMTGDGIPDVVVSENLLPEVAKRDDLTQVGDPGPITFDATGYLLPF